MVRLDFIILVSPIKINCLKFARCMCIVTYSLYAFIFADDPKSQLEREVAKSLLSLSKMSHQSVSEGYVNAGLVPLNARPNTYPYKFSALSPLSSKPHTPTLTSISEQKERESVSQSS